MINWLVENSPVIGTLFFFGIFCLVIYILFRKGAKKKFDKYSKIPMEDDKI